MSRLSGAIFCTLWFVIAVADYLAFVLSPYLFDNLVVHKKRFTVAMLIAAIAAGLCVANTGVSCIFAEAYVWRVLYAITLSLLAYLMSRERWVGALVTLCLGASIAITIERHLSATFSNTSLYIAATVFIFCGILCWCYSDYKNWKEWQARQS